MSSVGRFVWILVFCFVGTSVPQFDATAEIAVNDSSVNVGGGGVDIPTCGGAITMCRTISYAIKRHQTRFPNRWYIPINVYPGIYGDVNHNGIIGEPGEESGGPDCNCMIHVDKQAILIAPYGADTVLIDASTTNLTAIHVDGNGSHIGHRDRGFTINASPTPGTAAITVNRSLTARIQSHRIHAKYGGIWGSNLEVYFNQIIGATGGPAIDAGTNAFVWGNTVLSSEEGIIIANGRIHENKIIGGGYAIEIYDPRNADVTKNTIVNNRYAGITVNEVEEGFGVAVAIHDNDIVGNGYADGTLCGVVNRSGGKVRASRNWWGSDGSGSKNMACDFGASVTITQNPRACTPVYCY